MGVHVSTFIVPSLQRFTCSCHILKRLHTARSLKILNILAVWAHNPTCGFPQVLARADSIVLRSLTDCQEI